MEYTAVHGAFDLMRLMMARLKYVTSRLVAFFWPQIHMSVISVSLLCFLPMFCFTAVQNYRNGRNKPTAFASDTLHRVGQRLGVAYRCVSSKTVKESSGIPTLSC